MPLLPTGFANCAIASQLLRRNRGSDAPSYRVGESSVTLNLFDVVGHDGADPGFVTHTGLAASAGVQNANVLPILDMGPPLHGHGAGAQIKASVVGTASLTDDEVRKLQTFVDRHANEHQVFLQFSMGQLLTAAPQMYCIHPHASPLRESDGRYVRTRFSCAGFVLEAYKTARIKLLLPGALPVVDFTVIKLAYPSQSRLIDSGRISAEALGLEGNGPWPVLLCGYLFHALNRDADVVRHIPYQPVTENRYFT